MGRSNSRNEAVVESSQAWRRFSMLLVASIWVTLAGCAANLAVDDAARAGRVATEQPRDVLQWRYVRFRMQRAPDNRVNSYLDLMLADQVLAPVIDRYGVRIPLWRFHRRWPEDPTGHQFSFIYYSPGGVAEEVAAEVQSHPLLRSLGEQGYLIEHQVVEGKAEDVAATSDPAWPESIQREWPSFIMGASRMWLGLVQTEASRHDSPDLHDRYRSTEEAIDKLWFNKGNHAFFHHLSALFGYKPLRVSRQDVMTF